MLLKHVEAPKSARYFRARILLVEDDEATAYVLKEFFQMVGYECIHVPSVQDIVELTADVKPILIIMDYLLPEINGGDLCGRLKRDIAFSKIPVIICSAYPRVYLSLGTYHSDAFVEKPFDLDDLLDTVNQLLHKAG